ncbi:hypothetical protein TMatcc_005024 [Talaromyces marneffei ATCC 18224]|uniref:Uncharacterized protein n=2 Tax=Talaromyces marneffei TaxID=37727 RepID=B6Q7F1_TALMQ|nr:uncharacterized protein EYB26_000068 [Talaromyces marneffei]EEA26693.1 conserved hypothetical protein [Talaromyces marneffei ATCC 18224]KAE8557562.1 hypothetical protein EYB25_002269 [Talaromyces marneffei]QGA12424.1 hypothetical protein EYB26_000068 [Talaromyces marneffei]
MQQSNQSQISFLGLDPESPTTLTNLTITNSIKSDVSLVKDPEFWRRFSVAIHQDEEQARQSEREKTESESWLARQRKKTHRSKVWGFVIALIIVLIACGAGIAIWLLSKNNWLRKDTHHAGHTQP